MMNKCLFLLLLSFLFLFSVSAEAEDLRVVIASDMHHLSPSLVTDETTLIRLLRASDGKVTQYSPEIMQTFISEIEAQRPDAVVLSGDLTLNGAAESHRELIALMDPLREAGIPVLVIPGNHDSTGTAYRFTEEGVKEIDGLTDAEFIEAYQDFGYAQAASRDDVSFSYVWPLSEKNWLLMLDVNANETYGSVRPETLEWIEGQLQDAQAAGAEVISVTHQNLLIHYSMFTFGYQINNAGKLMELFKQYGVRLNLSGHMHLQHIAEKDGIVDIATSALSVWPNQYGVLTITDEGIVYDTRKLDMAAWAENEGITDDILLDFDDYSREFFDAVTRDKQLDRLTNSDIPEDAKAALAEYAALRNRHVFAGTQITADELEGLMPWQEYLPDSFTASYMQTETNTATTDMNHFSLPRK